MPCFHEAILNQGVGDLVFHLWQMTCDTAANHVIALVNIASSQEDGGEALAEAWGVGEEAVQSLSGRKWWAKEETARDEQAKKVVRKRKAKLSFRLHLVCKALGDLDTAVGYLREAMLYEPETGAKLRASIGELEAQGAGDEDDVVVKWSSVV